MIKYRIEAETEEEFYEKVLQAHCKIKDGINRSKQFLAENGWRDQVFYSETGKVFAGTDVAVLKHKEYIDKMNKEAKPDFSTFEV